MKQFEELERGATADIRDLPFDLGREILKDFALSGQIERAVNSIM